MFATSSGQTRTLAGHFRIVLNIPVLGITGQTRTYPFRDVRLSGAQWRVKCSSPANPARIRVSVYRDQSTPLGSLQRAVHRGGAEPRVFTS